MWDQLFSGTHVTVNKHDMEDEMISLTHLCETAWYRGFGDLFYTLLQNSMVWWM